jgi:uncharacterized membrane protein
MLATQVRSTECATSTVAVKFTPVTFAALIVTLWLAGVKEKPVLLGMTRYVPFNNPVKLKLPELLVVVVAAAAPLRVTIAPLPPVVGLMVPETLNVGVTIAVKFIAVTFAPLTVTAWIAGLNV